MVASLAYYKLKKGKISGFDLDAKASSPLSEEGLIKLDQSSD
jgi:hypothetical protein